MASKTRQDFTGAVEEKAAGEIFGSPVTPPNPPASPNLIARPISIHEILPDPQQPRRQIPSVIRLQWDGEAETVGGMFSTWAAAFAEENNRTLDQIEAVIDQVLEGEEVSPAEVYQGERPDPKRHWGVIGASLMAVVNLAAEIRRDGLTNPITIVRNEDGFQIETGERRWLAFHLLNIFYPDSTAWKRIPAREVTASSVWRQASENTARAQLNAISMARQLAILLMDLYGPGEFQSFYQMVQQWGHQSCDRAYYAQVADGNVWRVPRGKGEQLVSAMGITNPVQLRQYRYLLRLPDEVWMLADDLNWTEFFIRSEIIEKAINESGMIALAQRHAYEAGYRVTDSTHTVTTVTVSDEEDVPTREELPIENANTDENKHPAPEMPTDNSDAQDDTDEPEIEPLAEVQLTILRAAHKQAALGVMWFTAGSIGAVPETLNRMAAQGLLLVKNNTINTSYQNPHYRIAPPGCAAVNLPVITTAPRSGGEFHSGSAAGGSTPPVTNNPDPDAEQRVMVKRALGTLQAAFEQYEFSVSRLQLEKVTLPDLQAEVNVKLKNMMEFLYTTRQRLPRNNA